VKPMVEGYQRRPPWAVGIRSAPRPFAIAPGSYRARAALAPAAPAFVAMSPSASRCSSGRYACSLPGRLRSLAERPASPTTFTSCQPRRLQAAAGARRCASSSARRSLCPSLLSWGTRETACEVCTPSPGRPVGPGYTAITLCSPSAEEGWPWRGGRLGASHRRGSASWCRFSVSCREVCLSYAGSGARSRAQSTP
jgi:hypothetical protein